MILRTLPVVVLCLWACKPASDEAAPAAPDAEGSSTRTTPPAATAPPAATETAGEKTSVTPTTAKSVPSMADLQTFVPRAKPGDPVALGSLVRLESGVEYAVLKEGTGTNPPAGAKLKVHLTGWLRNGDKLGRIFWNSRDDGVPHEYELTEDSLIAGCVEALKGMKPGERRWVLVPSELAYGRQGYYATVPSNADLVFDLELVGFSEGG